MDISSSSSFSAQYAHNCIRLDLLQAKSFDIDRFLVGLGIQEDALVNTKDTLAKSIANSQAVQILVEEYCKPVANEKDRYSHFCELVNYISLEIGTQNVIFCRNDPNVILGSRGQINSPGIIGIDSNDPRVANGTWRNYHSGPRDVTWTWYDILFIVEFRLIKNAISLDERERVLGGPSGHQNRSPQCGGRSSKDASDGSNKMITTAIGRCRPKEQLPSLRGLQRQAALLNSSKRRRTQADSISVISHQKRTKLDAETLLGNDHAEMMASYAVNQLSNVQSRHHCIECLVVDGVMFMAYYDRIGILHSNPLEFVNDRYKFVLLIKALSSMTRSEAGFLEELVAVSPKAISSPNVTVSHNKVNSENMGVAISTLDSRQMERNFVSRPDGSGEDASLVCPDTVGQVPEDRDIEERSPKEAWVPEIDHDSIPLINGRRPQWKIEFGEDVLYLFHAINKRPRYSLVTRGTAVYVAICLTLDDPRHVYAVKISWQLAKRRSESLILRDAKEVLERIDRTRGEEFSRKYGHGKVADCLPKLYADAELVDLLGEKSFRKRALGVEKYEQFRGENRIWRALAYELLVPLHWLPTIAYFKQAIRDVVIGHHFLCTQDILHRDISTNNIMARIECEHSMHGVLNDWDLASVGKSREEGRKGTRTGTRPFMAIELLAETPPPHLERFDWESIFYVICHFGCRYSNPEEVCPAALSEWDEPEDSKLMSIKHVMLLGFGPEMNFTEFYQPLVDVWINPLRNFFAAGMQARNTARYNPSFDMETLDGRVTWDEFWDILSRDTAPEQASAQPPEGISP